MENNRRIALLNKFGDELSRYLCGTEFGSLLDGPRETQDASEARSELNHMLNEVTQILYAAGCPPVLQWSPPPMIGGRGCNLNVIINLFRLNHYMIKPREVLDFIERAAGIYEGQHRAAVIRTLNPFFWISRLIGWIASLPFAFLGHIGLPRPKIESSVIGKIFKGVTELATGIATIAGMLKLSGWFDPVVKFLQIK